MCPSKGSIVNNASINGIRGNHRLVAYSASKGGVVATTMAMALDYAPRGIRVNCVCPAAIENTRMDAISAARAPDPQQRREYLLAKHVAYAMLFLASDESSFTTHGWRQIHPVSCHIFCRPLIMAIGTAGETACPTLLYK